MTTISSLYVKILGDSTGLQRSIGTATAALKGFEAAGASAATSATRTSNLIKVGFVAAGVAAVAGIEKGIQATQEWAGEVRQLQRVTGQSAEQASALAGGAETLGISVDQLTVSFGLLSKNIVNGAPNLVKYGIAVRDAKGNLLPFDDILDNVADKFVTLKPGAEQAAFAMNVFGRSGKTLIPILAKGSEFLDELRQRAEDAGLVMSQETLDAAKDLSVAQRELNDSVKGASISLGVAFLPVAKLAVDVLVDLVQAFVAIPTPVKAVVLGFVAITGAIAGVQLVLGFFVRTWGGLLSVFGLTAAPAAAAATGVEVAGASAGLAVPEVAGLTAAVTALNTTLGGTAFAAAGALEGLTGFGLTEGGLIAPTEALAAAEKDLAVSTAAVGTAASGAVVKVGLLAGFLKGLRALAPIGAGAFALGSISELPIPSDLAQIQTQLTKIATLRKAIAQTTVAGDVETFKKAIEGARQLALETGADAQAFALAERQGISYSAAVDKIAENQTKALVTGQGLLGVIRQTFASFTEGNLTDLAGGAELVGRAFTSATQGLGQLAKASGQDFASIRDSVLKALADPATKVEELPGIFAGAIGAIRQQLKAWHDSIVANFGGAGSALEDFAGKSDVNLGAATNHLQDYTRQIRLFGNNIQSIQKRFGHDARDFILWASSQGLAQAGLVDAVAKGNDAMSQSFIDNFNKANKATDTLADQIVAAFGKVGDKIIKQLQRVSKAIQGIPVVKPQVDSTSLDNLITKLGNVTNAINIVNQAIDAAANAALPTPPQTHRHHGGYIFHDGGSVLHGGGMPRNLGPDEVPAILQRGEFVLQRSAVQSIGRPALEAMNRLHDGGPVPSVPALSGAPLKVEVNARVEPDVKRFTRRLDLDPLTDGYW